MLFTVAIILAVFAILLYCLITNWFFANRKLKKEIPSDREETQQESSSLGRKRSRIVSQGNQLHVKRKRK